MSASRPGVRPMVVAAVGGGIRIPRAWGAVTLRGSFDTTLVQDVPAAGGRLAFGLERTLGTLAWGVEVEVDAGAAADGSFPVYAGPRLHVGGRVGAGYAAFAPSVRVGARVPGDGATRAEVEVVADFVFRLVLPWPGPGP